MFSVLWTAKYCKLNWYDMSCEWLKTVSAVLWAITWLCYHSCELMPSWSLLYYPSPKGFLLFFQGKFCNENRLLFFIGMKHWELRKESLWSRSLRISLSCWLSTWQLSKMSFSFDQSHPQRYLIHPIIWLVEQFKISSNQKRRSKADDMKVRTPPVLTRGFLFSALSASRQ